MEFPSINPLIIKNIITDTSVPSVDLSIIIFFYYQRIYRRTKNYRQKIHRRRISVGDSVGKLITDEICVLRRRKNSIGKTIKSCSGTTGRGSDVWLAWRTTWGWWRHWLRVWPPELLLLTLLKLLLPWWQISHKVVERLLVVEKMLVRLVVAAVCCWDGGEWERER